MAQEGEEEVITLDRDIVILDTETLGLDSRAPIWEFAATRLRQGREPIMDRYVAYAYAAAYGDAVCSTLDSYPTLAGVSGIGQAIRDDGLTLFQAGQVIEISVHEICPRHLGLLDRFIQTYSPRSAIA